MRNVCLFLALLLLTAGCGGKPPIACLAEGTPVATPSGPVPIEALRLGDAVYSVNPETGERIVSRVVAIRSARRPALSLRTRSGRTVVATAEHPFYSPDTRGYEKLIRWQDGELDAQLRVAIHEDEQLVPDAVVSLMALPGTHTVYDITVSSRFHNFVAAGILVHNKSPVDRPIEEFVSAVENVATSEAATLQPDYPPLETGTAIALSLSADPFTSGVGVVHVTSVTPLDAVLVSAGGTRGYYELALPAPAMAVDLRITLASEGAGLFVQARSGADVGPAAFIQVP